MTLIPLVSFAVYANFSAGVKVWQAVGQGGIPAEDVDIFFQKVSVDFFNAFKYTSLPFSGDSKKVTFASLIDTERALGGDQGIGEVSFFYDAGKQAIVKEEKNVSQIYKEKPGKAQVMLRRVSSFQVSFFTFDKLNDAFVWQESWDPQETILPVAVKFRFELTPGTGPRESFIRTFVVPAGGA